ncbi:MAG: hypothetical protein ABJJ26_03745, partial [Algoriphagus sp.]|uniref:hypothetical protein n=1 Tax=Algoriphagus sp. TaxID=1872435 RepID=UPI00329A03C0
LTYKLARQLEQHGHLLAREYLTETPRPPHSDHQSQKFGEAVVGHTPKGVALQPMGLEIF